MPRNSYQYGTSPRKYEPEYTRTTTTAKRTKNPIKQVIRKENKNKVNTKMKEKTVQNRTGPKCAVSKTEPVPNVQEGKSRALQVVIVFAIFGMLLTVSYREITIMEMFNQKKNLENNLSVIQKEDGQVEKSIKEVESTLDWNSIQQKAAEQLGMQKKAGTPVDLDKTDNVETSNKLIKNDKSSIIDKVIEYFINK